MLAGALGGRICRRCRGSCMARRQLSGKPKSSRDWIGTAFTLVAVALLYSTIAGEYHGVQWFIWLSILINAALAGAMWWLSTKYT